MGRQRADVRPTWAMSEKGEDGTRFKSKGSGTRQRGFEVVRLEGGAGMREDEEQEEKSTMRSDESTDPGLCTQPIQTRPQVPQTLGPGKATITDRTNRGHARGPTKLACCPTLDLGVRQKTLHVGLVGPAEASTRARGTFSKGTFRRSDT